MQTYYQEADDTLAPLHVPGGTRITTHLLLRRVNFANGGYEELRQKVDAIKAMNGALNAIAPPLPTYYNSVGFIGKTVPTAPLSAIPAVAHEEDEDRLGPVIGDELEVQDGVISTKDLRWIG
ncbi:hypothetical protein KJ359_007141 [Pestalotiopsis sp. 9143b]|nr:hypothetical protein KJ359_007141 [Pestalotiopsis sp. 9143b]